MPRIATVHRIIAALGPSGHAIDLPAGVYQIAELDGGVSRKHHESQAAACRYVAARAEDFRVGMLRAGPTCVTVWVDERDGHGRRLYERIQLADYGTED